MEFMGNMGNKVIMVSVDTLFQILRSFLRGSCLTYYILEEENKTLKHVGVNIH